MTISFGFKENIQPLSSAHLFSEHEIVAWSGVCMLHGYMTTNALESIMSENCTDCKPI